MMVMTMIVIIVVVMMMRITMIKVTMMVILKQFYRQALTEIAASEKAPLLSVFPWWGNLMGKMG